MHRRIVAPIALAALAAGVLAAAAPPADAGWVVARDAKKIRLKVDGHGKALVSFTKRGKRYHVLTWGAVNAIGKPDRDRKQREFKRDYSGGFETFGYPYWKRMNDRCRRYDGPPLKLVVRACKAPDGSYWVLQRFRRMLPNVGRKPRTKRQAARELHLAHWSRGLPRFWIKWDWIYRAKGPFDHLYGRLSYRGHGVYGFEATRAGEPLDNWGRLVYVDTHNPRWGRGWFRYNSFLTQRPPKGSNNPGGYYCMGVWKTLFGRRGGKGDRYRATVRGPGVFPWLRWEGPPPGSYVPGRLAPLSDVRQPFSAAEDDALNREQKQVFDPRAPFCYDNIDK
jgi:hypothetical protein